MDDFHKSVTPFEEKYEYNLKDVVSNIICSKSEDLDVYILNIRQGNLSAEINAGKIDYTTTLNNVINNILDPLCRFYNQKFEDGIYPNIYYRT